MALSRVKLTPIHRGDPRTIVVTIKAAGGAPIDLSQSDWVSTVRTLIGSTAGDTLEIDESQAAAGVLSLHLSGEKSAALGNTLEGDLQGSDFGTVLEFSAIVRGDVSRTPSPAGGLIDNITLTWGVEGSTLSDSVMAVVVPGTIIPLEGVTGFVAVPAAQWPTYSPKLPTVLYIVF